MLTGTSRVSALALDSSIIVAILGEEDGFDEYVDILNGAKELLIGAPTLAEVGIVLQSRMGPDGLVELLLLLERWEIRVVEFTRVHSLEAIEAYRRYGKGNHPAGLNFGDCNSYATAKLAGTPLLYKGDDFVLTDLPPLRR